MKLKSNAGMFAKQNDRNSSQSTSSLMTRNSPGFSDFHGRPSIFSQKLLGARHSSLANSQDPSRNQNNSVLQSLPQGSSSRINLPGLSRLDVSVNLDDPYQSGSPNNNWWKLNVDRTLERNKNLSDLRKSEKVLPRSLLSDDKSVTLNIVYLPLKASEPHMRPMEHLFKFSKKSFVDKIWNMDLK